MNDLDRSVFLVSNLTEDNLKEFSLSRVKRWNDILNNLPANEDLDDVVSLSDIENFGSDAEEQERETDSEEYEAKDGEDSFSNDESVVNISVIEQNLTVESNAQKILAVIAQNPNETGILNEDRKFLEKTLPIFEMINRKMRRDGFEKLLNTFDQRKIDGKVGTIERRRNHCDISAFNRDCHFRGGSNRLGRCAYEHDDTDSDSVDEARYVRSTKKCCDYSKRYEMTTIKSYCSVKNVRDKQRKKYAYDGTNRTMQELNHGLKQRQPTVINAYQSLAGHRSCNHSIEKRCIAHKSHNNTKRYHQYYCDSSSFEEDELVHSKICIDTSSKRALHCRCLLCISYSNDDTKSRQWRHRPNFQISCCRRDDMLPFIRESECECRETGRLCNHARHLANTSTESWLVENYDSSESDEDTNRKIDAKKRQNHSSKEDQQRRGISKQSKANNFRAEDAVKEVTLIKTKSQERVEQKSNTTRKNLKRFAHVDKAEKSTPFTKKALITYKEIEIQQPTNSKSSFKKSEHPLEDTTDLQEIGEEDSFEEQLQLALKASKESYAEKQKRRQKKQAESSTNKTKHIIKNESGKTAKKNVSFQDEREMTTGKGKKQFAPQLADISSESESKENYSKENNIQYLQTNGMRRNAKAFSNLELEKNKKGKGIIKTASVPSARKPKTHKEVADKTKATKSKLHGTSNSESSDECLKPRIYKQGDSQKSYVDKENALKATENNCNYALQMHKLRICDDSSSDSSDANNTVKANTKQNATVSENTTFFTNPGQICNSTALVAPIAKSRQLLSTAKHSKNNNNNKTANSTDNSYEQPSTSKAASAAHAKLPAPRNELGSPTDSSDCKRVSSTTETEKSTRKTSKSNRLKLTKGRTSPQIILYTPHDTTLVPESSFVNERYHLTLEHLGSIIGQKYAEVFFRYYRGKRDFNLASTVKYIPPKMGYYSGNDTCEDDIDPLDLPNIGQISEEKN